MAMAAERRYWKRVMDDGTASMLFRCSAFDMEAYSPRGPWHPVEGWFWTVREEPGYEEITEAEADDLIRLLWPDADHSTLSAP
jgi:hypothetical protein